jgi:two-component system OmpR family response regulator
VQFADLQLDEQTRSVRRDGRVIRLTPTEFELLRYLMTNARTVVSKRELLDRIWRYDFGGDGRVVESYVCYLRRKLGPGDAGIHTIRRGGYVLR